MTIYVFERTASWTHPFTTMRMEQRHPHPKSRKGPKMPDVGDALFYKQKEGENNKPPQEGTLSEFSTVALVGR